MKTKGLFPTKTPLEFLENNYEAARVEYRKTVIQAETMRKELDLVESRLLIMKLAGESYRDAIRCAKQKKGGIENAKT